MTLHTTMDSSLFLLHRKGSGVKVNTSQRTLILLAPVVTPGDTGMGEGGDSLRLRLRVSCDQSAGQATPSSQSVSITDIYSIVRTENGKENTYQKKCGF